MAKKHHDKFNPTIYPEEDRDETRVYYTREQRERLTAMRRFIEARDERKELDESLKEVWDK